MELNSRGKIYSISLKNFVTYDEITVYPQPNLNVITGPNGSGKSTIVAAILLVMGGNPKLLSRASKVEDYIKNGKDKAEIQIVLYKDANLKTIFQRNFGKDGKSVWMINNEVTSVKNYQKQVADFNIQIDNLCQFLPQDRVQDFTSQNPQELLASTQTSVCDINVVEWFESLKELRTSQMSSKKKSGDNAKKLADATKRNAQLQEIINRINEKNEFLEAIKIREAKKGWLEVKEIETKLQETKGELQNAETYCKRNRKVLSNIEKKAKDVLDVAENFKSAIRNGEKILASLKAELETTNASNENLEKDVRSSKREVENAKQEENERLEQENRVRQLVELTVQDLKNAKKHLGDTEDFEQEISKCKGNIDKIKQSCRETNAQYAQLGSLIDDNIPEINSIKDRIRKMENIDHQKLLAIKDSNPDVYKAVNWLRDNQDRFEGKVYNPLILELNIPDIKNAVYVENTVSNRDLYGFICESRNDMNLMVRLLVEEQNLKISCLNSPPAESCQYKPTTPIQEFRAWGFQDYLLNLVSGPPAILNFLCYNYKFHNILIGNHAVEQYSESLPSHIRLFFGGTSRYSINVSKYTGDVSSIRSQIRSSNMFTVNFDEVAHNRLTERLKEIVKMTDKWRNEKSQLETKMNQFELSRKENQQKINSFESRKSEILTLTEKLKTHHSKIAQLQKRQGATSRAEEKYKKALSICFIGILSCVDQKRTILQKICSQSEKVKLEELKLQKYKLANAELENAIKTAKEDLENSTRLCDTIRSAYDRLRTTYNNKKTKVFELCGNTRPNQQDFPYKEQFNSIPDNLQELNDQINDFQARVECMTSENTNVIDEFEQRQREIERLESVIMEDAQSTSVTQKKISVLHEKWYPKIKETVEEINKYFGEFMRSMQYAGEVQLIHDDDINNYESYGIQISVQYRNNGKLQPLSRHLQSGGERAVAIAVYSLSLQHITNVPFRCVDEINQGMDPRNERKIFEMLVEETSKSGRSQYFFVTPKVSQFIIFFSYFIVMFFF
ncbi:SMC5 family protein [Megaselia abdita]